MQFRRDVVSSHAISVKRVQEIGLSVLSVAMCRGHFTQILSSVVAFLACSRPWVGEGRFKDSWAMYANPEPCLLFFFFSSFNSSLLFLMMIQCTLVKPTERR